MISGMGNGEGEMGGVDSGQWTPDFFEVLAHPSVSRDVKCTSTIINLV